MAVDQTKCWNPTWIAMDNVAYAIEIFFQAHFFEVGLMKIATAQGSLKISAILSMIFLLMFIIFY
jgi:hypothetical protein